MVAIDFTEIELKLKKQEHKTYVFDPIRKGWFVLTPEEHVRQYIIAFLTSKMQYPASLIAVEKMIKVNNLTKRFDLIVYNRDLKPWMLIECKAPEVTITKTTLNQLLLYNQKMQCSFWVLTNGHQTYCADASDHSNIKWIDNLPTYSF